MRGGVFELNRASRSSVQKRLEGAEGRRSAHGPCRGESIVTSWADFEIDRMGTERPTPDVVVECLQ
jgi:hypothetical protein